MFCSVFYLKKLTTTNKYLSLYTKVSDNKSKANNAVTYSEELILIINKKLCYSKVF